MPLPRSWASRGGGVGGGRKEGRTKTIAGGVKVQEAFNRRAGSRRWFVKLGQPGLMARAAAAAATDNARRVETGCRGRWEGALTAAALLAATCRDMDRD